MKVTELTDTIAIDTSSARLVDVSSVATQLAGSVWAFDCTKLAWLYNGVRLQPAYGGGKHFTGLGMLGQLTAPTIVVESSGGFGAAVSRLRSELGLQTFVVVKHNLETGKINRIVASGGEVIRAPADSNPTVYGENYADGQGWPFINQYSVEAPGNAKGHRDFMAPLMSCLYQTVCDGLPATLIAATGSGGTVMGLHQWLAYDVGGTAGRETKLWAVRPSRGERIPGARDEVGLQTVTQLDRSVVDHWFECTERVAYQASQQLIDAGFCFGPSAGACFRAAEAACSDPSFTPVVFMVWDDPGPYTEEYVRFGLIGASD
jgi:cysteine synthase